ncbi:MAG: hypothetical protein ACRD5L_10470, partial [Bryobacteraceae bacterium]
VLPYVYALRGDRDWRRVPQLTGSRQVSPLAVQAYKRLEIGEATIPELKQSLGHGVSETAVLRAITELWQQLRIIPVVSAPGRPARWQLLKTRYQKAIAEGASTSQVTAISVLASIFLQAVIAAGMEEVEIFLSPLTARSKIREVLRGLVATRQVHTLTLGHSTQYYVAGTLPEFTPPPTVYASSLGSAYLSHIYGHEDSIPEPTPSPIPVREPLPPISNGNGAHRPASNPAHAHHGRASGHVHDHKPARPAGRGSANGSRWQSGAAKSSNGSHNGNGSLGSASRNGASSGNVSAAGNRNSAAWKKRKAAHPTAGPKSSTRPTSRVHGAVSSRRDARAGAKPAHGTRKTAISASRRKSYGIAARQGSKKRG